MIMLIISGFKSTNNGTIKQGHCLVIWDNYHDTIYYYITANKVLLKLFFIIFMLLLNHPDLWLFIFFHEKYFTRIANSITIHLYCFSQYQKYLCKVFTLWRTSACLDTFWNSRLSSTYMCRLLWYNLTDG